MAAAPSFAAVVPGSESVAKAPEVPKFAPPSHEIRFSSPPTDSELILAGLFEVPLVPLAGAVVPDENADLGKALLEFHVSSNARAIEDFLQTRPQSRWRAALLLNLGILYRNQCLWSKTIPAWEEAWSLTKESTVPRLKSVADRSLGEMAMMHGHLGHYERLQSLFEEIKGRDVRGPGSEDVSEAKAGLWLMLNKPDEAFRCGPIALSRLYCAINHGKPYPTELVNFKSTSKGTNLEEILAYAEKIGLPCQLAYRSKGADVLVPAIVNWKVEHYAALTAGLKGEFLSQDLTFGGDCLISKETLDSEASGYFVVRRGPLPSGWRSVSVDEARTVYGRGNTGPTGPKPSGCGTTGAGGKAGGGNSTCDCQSQQAGQGPQGAGYGPGCAAKGSSGMTTYSFDAASISLQLVDTPLQYSPPIGQPVWLTASYNHRNAVDMATISNLGDKWNLSWVGYIQAASTAATIRYGPGSGQITYTGFNSTTQSFAPDLTTQDVLTLVGSNSYVLTHKDGAKEIYSLSDNSIPARVFLTSSVDPFGNAVTYNYDSTFRLQTVTDAIGQTTVLYYGLTTDQTDPSFYLITKVTDPFGRSATFQYNEYGQLASITDVLGIQSSFIYGAGDFVTALTTPYGTTTFAGSDTPSTGNIANQFDRWLTATDPLGAVERIEWNNNATNFQDVNSAGDSSSAPSGFQNEFVNYRTTFYWDKEAMMTHPNDPNYAFLYHFLHAGADNSMLSYVLESTKAPLENRVWMAYPGQTNGTLEQGSTAQPSRIARLLDDGTEQDNYYQYNSLDNITQSIDPLGRETDYTYAPNQVDVVQIQQKNGAGFDTLASYTYNSQHLPLTYTDASGQVTTYTYNSFGELLTVTNAKNETTTFSYNANGYLVLVTGPVAGATTAFTYDGFGRVATVTDSAGYAVSYAYDAADRIVTVTYPDGTYNQVLYNLLDPQWTRDRMGQWSLALYDPLRRLVLQQDPQVRKTIYQRCPCGALIGIIDPMGNETKFTIDLQSRVTQKTYPDGTAVSYTYEKTTSRLSSVTDPDNQTKSFSYNLDNSVKGISYTNAVNATAPVSFAYDPVYLRVTSMTDGVGTTNYAYNPVTGSPTLGALQLAGTSGPLAQSNSTVTYTYDPLGRTLTTSINGSANLSSVAYDALGRVTGASNPLGAFAFSYVNQTSRLASVGYPNGQTTNFSYFPNSSGNSTGNGDDRIQQIANLSPGGGNLSSYGYTYDPNGQIQTWSTQLDGGNPLTATFQIDAAQQILSASMPTAAGQPAKAYSYEYDLDGNRTEEQVDNSTTASGYNSLDQLTNQGPGDSMTFTGTMNEPGTVYVGGNAASVDGLGNWTVQAPVSPGANSLALTATDLNGNVARKTIKVTVLGGGSRTLTYDANGNLLNNGAGQTYQWDAENRLISIVQSSGTTGFVYDGSGHRAKETLNGSVIKQWVWCGSQPCEEWDGNGNVTKRFYAQGEQIAGVPYFYTRDHLGSVREMTDSTGAVRARYAYDPYGRIKKIQGDLDADFGFTGDYFHKASGLNLTLYRAYDPNLGRWLSRDPIGGAGGLNLYGYVENDPIFGTDPLGLTPEGAIIGGIVGGYFGGTSGGSIGGTVGVIVGGSGGTLVEPVGGTLVGAAAGGAVGVQVGTAVGATAGASIGAWIGDKISDLYVGMAGTKEDKLPTGGSCPFKGKKQKSGEKIRNSSGGYQDSSGNSWQWDPIKGEWDVQHPDGTHTNVGPDGEITHGKNNF